ncbi:hypothetical protein NXW97_24260, partial [Bacteroides faecis]
MDGEKAYFTDEEIAMTTNGDPTDGFRKYQLAGTYLSYYFDASTQCFPSVVVTRKPVTSSVGIYET